MMQFRPRWLAPVAAAFALLFSGAALAETPAEAFVTEKANEALRILNDDSIPLPDKKARFRALVDEVADVPRITRFVLGRYSRGLDEAELAAFSEAFRSYAIGIYEDRLGDYKGETLEVSGSTERAPGDVVVHTQIAGGGQEEPLPVNWRVLTDANGAMRVVDVEVYGVWLAINQREEIVGIIENNRGRVAAATDALRVKLTELDAG